MIEIVAQNGKKLGEISDSVNEIDMIMVNGTAVPLSDAYDSKDIIEKFNKDVRALKIQDA